MNDTTKKTKGRPRVTDLRATFSLRVRQSVIDRLPEFGGRAGAGDMIEACVTGCTPPNAPNVLVLSEETMKILREKAEVADCSVATLVEAAIKMFDTTPFEAARREAQALMDRALSVKANAFTMFNREVVATHLQAPIPSPVATPVFRDFDTVSREMSAGIDTSNTPNPFVNPNAPVAPVAPKLPTLADAYARLNRSSAAARSEAPEPVETPTNTHFLPVVNPNVELEPAPRHPDQGPLDPVRQADLDFSNRYRATIGLPPSTWLEYLDGTPDPYGPLLSAAPIPSVNFDFRPKTGFAVGGN